MTRSIPTVIIDDSALFRAGLMHILAGTRFEVMPGCWSLEDIQKGALGRHVCLVLVGLDKDAWVVLSKVSLLKAQHEYLRVIIFSDRFDLEELLIAIASGGDCYLLKNEINPDAFLKSLDLVLLGQTIFPQGFTQLIRGQVRLQQEAPSPGNHPETRLENRFPVGALQTDNTVRLSSREQMILSHLTQGASNKRIARELEITEATVKTHVKSLLHKTGVRNRTQAAMWAMNHLTPSCVDEAKSLKPSAGLSVLLTQLGAGRGELGLDLADEPDVARQVEAAADSLAHASSPQKSRASRRIQASDLHH